MARSAKNTKDIRVAFVVPSMHLNARRILSGICRYATINRNLYVRIANGDSDQIFPTLKSTGIQGAFVTAPLTDAASADRLAASLPCIALGSLVVPKVAPYLTADSYVGGQLAASHLLDLGLRNLAYFSTSKAYWSQLRMQGFCQRAQEAGVQPAVYTGDGTGSLLRDWRAGTTWLKDMQSAVNWLRSLPKPVGLMACDDPMGYDIIEVAEEIGIRVPEEVAVVGLYNDEAVCCAARPPLSSVAINLEKAGYQAAELLCKIITGKEKMAGQAILGEAVKVVARQSSEILAIAEPQVAAAMHFIRTHFHLPIQVTDVVKAAGIGRRTLELRFRTLFNRSILDEIIRMRIEHVADVLTSTDLSIEQIAAASNFESAGYMSKVFKRHKGLSPSEFRRTHSQRFTEKGGN